MSAAPRSGGANGNTLLPEDDVLRVVDSPNIQSDLTGRIREMTGVAEANDELISGWRNLAVDSIGYERRDSL
ncbi:hypothetical protein ABIE33_006925 [Ensifer sp. 4252]